jgi:uncharacterized membrane protein
VRGSALRWIVSLALAIAGIADAIYLTIVHYDSTALVCGIGDCHTVQASKYAEIAGVPIAILGLLMYVAITVLGAARFRLPAFADRLTFMNFALALAGTAYAAYLTYLEIAVINAICQWCVVSALLTLAILLVEGTSVWFGLEAPEEA